MKLVIGLLRATQHLIGWFFRAVFRLPLDNSTNAQPQKLSSEVFARVTDLKYIDFSPDLPPPIAGMQLQLLSKTFEWIL